MFQFVADISWICLPYIQWALFLGSCPKYRQPQKRQRHKKRKMERQLGWRGGSGFFPGAELSREVAVEVDRQQGLHRRQETSVWPCLLR